MTGLAGAAPLSQNVLALVGIPTCSEKVRIAFFDDGVAVIEVRHRTSRPLTLVRIRRNCLSRDKVVALATTELKLSGRQAAAAYLIARGASPQAIAEVMKITPNTARRHIEAVYLRLQVNSRRDVERVLARMVVPHVLPCPDAL